MKPRLAVDAEVVRDLLNLVATNLDLLAATEVEDLWANHLPADLAELAQRVRDQRDALCSPKAAPKGIGITRGRRKPAAQPEGKEKAE